MRTADDAHNFSPPLCQLSYRRTQLRPTSCSAQCCSATVYRCTPLCPPSLMTTPVMMIVMTTTPHPPSTSCPSSTWLQLHDATFPTAIMTANIKACLPACLRE
ncbi:hypothetical protein ECG_05757 [Echinococcus granulosus]|nr:hypothetical protein ECG_05757 [Echinococcus granulosus]